MIELIRVWWLLPMLVTFIGLMLVLRYDKQDLRDFESDDWWALAIFLIVWPVGIVAIIVTVAVTLREK